MSEDAVVLHDSHHSKVVRKYTRLLVHRPCLVCSAGWCVLLLMMAAVIGGGLTGLSDNTEYDYLVSSDQRVREQDAVEQAMVQLLGGSAVNASQSQQTIDDSDFDVFMLYRAKQGNLFDPKVLQDIKTAEEFVFSKSAYNQVCLLESGVCKAPSTFVKPTARANIAPASYVQVSDPTNQTEIQEVRQFYLDQLNNGSQLSTYTGLRSIMFDKSFNNPVGNAASNYGRSYLPMGIPLQGFRNEDDRIDDQREKWTDLMKPISDHFNGKDTAEHTEIIMFGNQVLQGSFADQVNGDLTWAAGSIIFVFAYMSFHIQSPVIALISVIMIVLTIPLALVMYRGVLQISYYATLHNLAIFIILGVGADSKFVFVDAWNQAPRTNMQERMTYTWARAAKTTFVTSFTTFCAFMATGISPIVPIGTFGFFAAFVIMFNFLVDITIFPAIIMLWEQKLRPLERKCFRCAPLPETPMTSPIASENPATVVSAKPSPQKADSEDGDGKPTVMHVNAISRGEESGVRSSRSSASSQDEDLHDEVHKLRAIEHFFSRPWLNAVVKVRYVLLVLFIAFFIGAAYSAAQLEPLSEEEQWFPESHWIGKASKWLDEDYRLTERDARVKVQVTWGVLDIDRDGVDKYDPEQRGKPVFDDKFDITTPAAQQAVLDTCTSAASLPMYRKTNSCFMQAYADFIGTANFPFVAPSGQNQATAFQQSMDAFLSSTTGKPYKFTRVFQDNDAGRIRLAQVEFGTTLEPRQPYDITRPDYDKWEAWIQARNAANGAGINRAIQTADFAWPWMMTERALISNALQGMAVSISVAFVVLVLSTMNFFVGLFATLSIVGIVGTVLAVMQWAGWQLGITESVAAVILIGMSVDYVVHIAVAYVESKEESRIDKTRTALAEIAISILAGAVTTLGAGAFLFGAVIIFFTKFGVLIVSTIAASFLWCMLFFVALLTTLGPQQGFGSLEPLFSKIGSCCGSRGKKNQSSKQRHSNTDASENAGAVVTADGVEMQIPKTSNV